MATSTQKQAAALRELHRIYDVTFASEEGQAVLHDLVTRFNITKPHQTTDPIELAMFEGSRATVLHILTMLRLEPLRIEALLRKYAANLYEDTDV